MKVAVIGGAGAMGGVLGGTLAEAGNEVVLVDVARDAVDRINAEGLRIESTTGATRSVHVPATTEPASVGPVDLAIVFTKCYHTENAVRSAMPLLAAHTTVLSLQNGWGNAPKIAALVGDERVLAGVTYHSATVIAPGHVLHTGQGVTIIGELNGGMSGRVRTHRYGISRRRAGRIADRCCSQRNLVQAGAQRVHAADIGAAALLRRTVDRARRNDRADARAAARNGRRRQRAGLSA